MLVDSTITRLANVSTLFKLILLYVKVSSKSFTFDEWSNKFNRLGINNQWSYLQKSMYCHNRFNYHERNPVNPVIH